MSRALPVDQTGGAFLLGEIMKELSIFVDESGDFGDYNSKYAPQYIYLMNKGWANVSKGIRKYQKIWQQTESFATLKNPLTYGCLYYRIHIVAEENESISWLRAAPFFHRKLEKAGTLREWLSWWSATLPRWRSRVRVPSRAR